MTLNGIYRATTISGVKVVQHPQDYFDAGARGAVSTN
jgi:hypothetical protein